MTRKSLSALLGDGDASASDELHTCYARVLQDSPLCWVEREAAQLNSEAVPLPETHDGLAEALLIAAVGEKQRAEEAARRSETLRKAYQQHTRMADAKAELDNSVEEVEQPRPSQAGVIKKACPKWLHRKLRQMDFLNCVAEGAKDQGKVLVPGTDFSAASIFEALLRLNAIPADADRKTTCAGIREFYNELKWRSRAKGDGMVDDLVAFYRAGEAIAKAAGDSKAQDTRKAFHLT